MIPRIVRQARPWAALLLILSCANASAGDCTPQVRDGWIRMLPAGMTMMAGFGRIENPCREAATITGASSPAFADTTLHETKLVDGVSRMRAVTQLHIAAGDSAVLAPGGLHLMLMEPTAKLAAGNKVTVQFRLAGGGTVSGEFELRGPGD